MRRVFPFRELIQPSSPPEKRSTMTRETSSSSPASDSVSKRESKSPSKPSEDVVENPEEERGQWGNKMEFILATLGMSVGVGNIWRYSALAYDNGGSAFLIPYISCSLLFAFPIVYAEFTMGQYARTGPAKALRNYSFAFEGLGWAMWFIAIPVAIYYAIVVAWSMIYLGFVMFGQHEKWNRCDNDWNTENCVSIVDTLECRKENVSMPYFWNGTCTDVPHEGAKGGADEFFMHFVTKRSDGLTSFEEMNWPMFSCICLLYAMVALVLCKGMKLIGKVTVPLPYIVLVVFLVRGVLLDGSEIGIRYYLLEPNWAKILDFNTWCAALSQVCFSIGLGYGNLMSMASYNAKDNNCFRDALIIVVGDSLMSIIGGVAAFSILGHMCFRTGKNMTEVISSGPSLAFVAYPEAVTTLPYSGLWAFLFFLMLFLLGFSSQIAYVDMVIAFCYDLFPKLKKATWAVAIAFCILIAACSSFMANNAQWYWFNLLSEFSATVAPCVVAGIEVAVLVYVYKWKNVFHDLEEMHGPAPRFWLRRIISRFSWFFPISWATWCPGVAIALIAFSMYRDYPMTLDKTYTIPIWAEIVGQIFNLGPLLPIPVFMVINYFRNRRAGGNWKTFFRSTEQLPSFRRIYVDSEVEKETSSEESLETAKEEEQSISISTKTSKKR